MSLAAGACHMRVSRVIDSVARRSRVEHNDEPSTVLLIRHAHTEAIDRSRLCGREPGITLSGTGVLQAEALGIALKGIAALSAVYSSPLERAQATAQAIARHQRAPVHVCDALIEIDFGAWTGKTFAELEADPAWRLFNRARAAAIIPGGETPCAVQQRVVAAVANLAAQHRGGTIALVSHAEIVRFALLRYLGSSLDRYHDVDIAPASVSAVQLSAAGIAVLFVNRPAAALHP